MLHMILTLVVYTAVVSPIEGYTHFQSLIPNGNSIPHPCIANTMWYGVGHQNSRGGGVRNPFGKDFEKWGYEWNICLCQEDSDGDGRTNGEELGDPECVWTVGEVPDRSHDLSHPGICDPFNGPECVDKNGWVDCEQDAEFKCDDIKEDDVKNVSVNIQRSAVPPKETTYICQTFNLTDLLPEGESHMIASTPRIDNANVIHHMIVYACDDVNAKTAMDLYENPKECGMEAQVCPTIVTLWAVGMDGLCLNNNFGFAMGTNGYKTFIIQFHWNNPELRSDYTDASGINFHVRTNKRPNDGGMWFIGPFGFGIPPAHLSYVQEGMCTTDCTQLMLDQPIYITDLIPHMHYFGTRLVFRQYRNGKLVYEKIVERYFYDSPDILELNPPVEVLPGDELKVECVFQTVEKKHMIYFGESTSEEMCFAMTMYYPYSANITHCAGNEGYGFCDNQLYPVAYEDLCDTDAFFKVLSDNQQIYTECDINGYECFPNCKQELEIFENTDCLTRNTSGLFEAILALNPQTHPVFGALHSCDPRPELPTSGDTDGNPSCDTLPAGSAHVLKPMFDIAIIMYGVISYVINDIL